MLFSTVEDKDAGALWQKLLKMSPANTNTKVEKSHCAQCIWGLESAKGEAPALLKSEGKSSLTSAKPVLKTSTWPTWPVGFTSNAGGVEKITLQMGFDNKFPGLGKC